MLKLRLRLPPKSNRRKSARLRLVPMSLREANAFVEALHRHHKRVQGQKFSIGCTDPGGKLVGVAIVGRPVARMTDAKAVAEVTRLCTDGTPNACSILYAACARACAAMGYSLVQTFILASESGASLAASGWHKVGVSAGGSWSRPSRGREDNHPTEPKVKWAKEL